MSEDRAILADTARRLLEDLGPQPDFTAGWRAVENAGLPALLLPEADGGFGGGWSDLMAVQWEAGRQASAFPLGDALLGVWAANAAGLAPGEGFSVLAPRLVGELQGDAFSGEASNLPWGRHARWVLGTLSDGTVIRLDTSHGAVSEGANLAGEPRDSFSFQGVVGEVGGKLGAGAVDVTALMRLGQISGALLEIAAMTAEYIKTRVQFGKPLGNFQAAQQALAVFAAEASAADCAAQAACAAAEQSSPGEAWYPIAAAKLRANMAIGVATSTAHQLHGAIGFTQEFSLHPRTRRLWSWRTEAGNDRYWAGRLAAHVGARGADKAWNDIAAA